MGYTASLRRQGYEMAAETISEHHIPSLAPSPSLDVTQGEMGDYAFDFDDSEFPYGVGILNGLKCCTKCGATKTPQWREGPFGPKTLCNACGVKRTRKLRAEQDGTKRRRLSSGGANASAAKISYNPKPRPAASQELLDSYGSQDGSQDDLQAPGSGYYHATAAAAVAAAPVARRPSRKAAEEAAAKTARYAKTGEWAGEHAATYALPHSVPSASLMAAAAAAAAIPSPAASDLSLPSSDCPEEVSWTPLAAEAAARSGLPGMPVDCYAAVNLMTMSVKSPTPPEGVEAPQQAQQGAMPPRAVTPPPLSRADLEATFAKMDGPNGGKLTAEDLSHLYRSVPPAKVVELIRLNQELDGAVSETQAANAAVAAVAAVLAARQAAALRAREAALAASKRLRRFMLELDTQFGVNHKTLPRIRTSPQKKATSA